MMRGPTATDPRRAGTRRRAEPLILPVDVREGCAHWLLTATWHEACPVLSAFGHDSTRGKERA